MDRETVGGCLLDLFAITVGFIITMALLVAIGFVIVDAVGR